MTVVVSADVSAVLRVSAIGAALSGDVESAAEMTGAPLRRAHVLKLARSTEFGFLEKREEEHALCWKSTWRPRVEQLRQEGEIVRFIPLQTMCVHRAHPLRRAV